MINVLAVTEYGLFEADEDDGEVDVATTYYEISEGTASKLKPFHGKTTWDGEDNALAEWAQERDSVATFADLNALLVAAGQRAAEGFNVIEATIQTGG